MSKNNDMIGKRFGKLTVLSESSERTESGHVKYLCRCDCGTEKIIIGAYLRIGKTKSCGCINRIIPSENHGENGREAAGDDYADAKRHIYSRWHTFKVKNQPICREWKVFPHFYRWSIESGYQIGAKLYRYDNTMPYSPENCVWQMMQPREKQISEKGNIDAINSWNKTVNVFREHYGLKPFRILEESEGVEVDG